MRREAGRIQPAILGPGNREVLTHASPTPDDVLLSAGAAGAAAPVEPQPAAEDRIRITSLVGTLASAAIVVAFFLPWLSVETERAQRYLDRMEERFEDPVHPVPAGVSKRDWLRLAALAAEQGYVSGLDVFYWARMAGRTAEAYGRAESADPDEPPATLSRAIHVVAIVLAVLPLVALLIALVFVVQRFRRAHSPMLVLAVLSGATAIAVPAAYSILEKGLDVRSEAAVGLHILGIAGPLLLLAGVFGVRLKNWWRVFMGAVIVGGGLALIAWAWLDRGSAP